MLVPTAAGRRTSPTKQAHAHRSATGAPGRGRHQACAAGTPRRSFCQPLQRVARRQTWPFGQCPQRERACPGGLHLGNTNVEEADGVALELLPSRLVVFDIRQARDAMTLQAPVQRRPCQVRDRRLQGIEAIVERQQRVPTESNNCRLLFFGQDRRARVLRPGLHVLDCRALAPLRHHLWIDAQLPAQPRERSLPSFGPALEPMAGRPKLLQL